ncbi:hypothetical protein V5R04_06955 [Jonesiaceae bacterium BS-20]|uniref:Uncharacterized protein n=1 Tax=Jonesiaceae bacterium BS-20 TaxID=3120821 RepID=A0AAU7DZX8_9MICO
MTTQTYNPNRVAAGVTSGGQFTTGTRMEPQVSLTPSATEPKSQVEETVDDVFTYSPDFEDTPENREALTAAVQDMYDDEHHTAIYVGHDDKLTDEQISSIMRGDAQGASDNVFESWGHESQWDGNQEFLRTHLGSHGIDLDDLDDDAQDTLREIPENHDDSDIFADLARNTGDQLFVAPVIPHMSNAPAATRSGNNEEATQARVTYLTAELTRLGIDPNLDSNRETIQELVENGPHDWHEGMRLEVLDYAPLTDAAPYDLDGEIYLPDNRETVYTNPHVVLMDRENGSGHSGQLTGTLTHTSEARDRYTRVDLDRTQGYSWENAAGIIPSYYKNEKVTRLL